MRALRAHRTRQLAERLKVGPRWVETGLVFTTYRTYRDGRGKGRKVGAALHPRNVLRVLHNLLDAADLPRVRFHDLRHTAASWLRMTGADIHTVAKILGHKGIAMTARYSHLNPEFLGETIAKLDGVFETPCHQGVTGKKQLTGVEPATVESTQFAAMV